LASDLGTSHQLLGHFLTSLEEWWRKKELAQFRANAKAKSVNVTPALERRYLAWLRRIEERQGRDAVRAAKSASQTLAAVLRANNNLPRVFRGSLPGRAKSFRIGCANGDEGWQLG
jgi:hypothetical protein